MVLKRRAAAHLAPSGSRASGPQNLLISMCLLVLLVLALRLTERASSRPN
jgi:hypothetical protein